MTSTESYNLLVKVKKYSNSTHTHTHDYLIKYKEINRTVVPVKLRLQSVKGARVGVTYIRIIQLMRALRLLLVVVLVAKQMQPVWLSYFSHFVKSAVIKAYQITGFLFQMFARKVSSSSSSS